MIVVIDDILDRNLLDDPHSEPSMTKGNAASLVVCHMHHLVDPLVIGADKDSHMCIWHDARDCICFFVPKDPHLVSLLEHGKQLVERSLVHLFYPFFEEVRESAGTWTTKLWHQWFKSLLYIMPLRTELDFVFDDKMFANDLKVSILIVCGTGCADKVAVHLSSVILHVLAEELVEFLNYLVRIAGIVRMAGIGFGLHWAWLEEDTDGLNKIQNNIG